MRLMELFFKGLGVGEVLFLLGALWSSHPKEMESLNFILCLLIRLVGYTADQDCGCPWFYIGLPVGYRL